MKTRNSANFIFYIIVKSILNIPNRFISSIYITISLLISNITFANVDITNEYLTKAIDCQVKLEKIRWSHNLWPQASQSDKPSFEEVVDRNQIKLNIIKNIKMEMALSELYDIELDQNLIQNELNRITLNTKDPKKLNALFHALNYDSNAISNCIVKPYIIKNILQKQFYWNKSNHDKTLKKAQKELEIYLNSKSDNKLHINTIIYNRKNTKPLTLNYINNELHNVELDGIQFMRKRDNLLEIKVKNISQSLIENDYKFVYEELLEINDNQFAVNVLSWEKMNFDTWWENNSQKWQYNNYKYKKLDLKLEKINANDNYVNKKNFKTLTEGEWEKLNVPIGRYSHTSIWTGNEMVIWGGRNGHDDLNSGSKYNPTTDSWTATSMVNAPLPRTDHTAIWSGDEMLIWGGYDGEYKNSGAKYNPTTDLWETISLIDSPEARINHTAIWTGDEMIIWGGDASGLIYGNGSRYDPNLDAWSSLSFNGSPPSSRKSHTAIWTGSEMIVWGGTNFSFEFNNGAKYNPLLNIWSPISITGAPAERTDHTSIWTGNNMIIWGGFNGVNGDLGNGAIYNHANDSWLILPELKSPSPRSKHTATFSGDEMIIWGGIQNGQSFLSDGASYNISKNKWTDMDTPNTILPRAFHTSTWTGNEMVVWGGRMNWGTISSTDIGEKYYPSNNSWSPIKSLNRPGPERFHTSIWTGNEMIVWGGTGSTGSIKNDGAIYDPVTAVWTDVSSLNAPDGRYWHTAVWTGIEMIIWGGYTNTPGNYFNSGSRYNPSTNLWTSINNTNAPSARIKHSAIWTGHDMIIWGGQTNDPFTFDDGAKYNVIDDEWTPISLTNTPRDRANHTAVWTGSKMIIWGGGISITRNTGGVYDPASDLWSSTSLIEAPPGRNTHKAIWTGTKMIIWGGDNIDFPFTSGGVYDPIFNTWGTISSVDEPEYRRDHTLVWTGTEMIVWGGYGQTGVIGNGAKYNPDEDNWINTSQVNAPLARSLHSATWTGEKMIVWGGTKTDMGIYCPSCNNDVIFQNSFEK